MVDDVAKPRDDEADRLPVTAEVGSEGGSYADPTTQVATERGDLPRSDGSRPGPSSVGTAAGAVARNPDSAEDGVRSPDDTRGRNPGDRSDS